ncbi:MAG: superoxide dismutase [Lentimicrobium sp.]|jgi:Fe-Mn family superoxide dismutase|nr:superoxide dismutase [Lentimicrobium sp.]
MKFELPPLPFKPEALEPVISAKTIEFHYGKHHQAYVNNLNNLVPGTRFENASLEEIIKEADGGIFNNGAQVWNHTFYWEGLGGNAAAPTGKLMERINKDFGTFDNFKEIFAEAAAKLFGSGWAWLVEDKEGILKIVQTSNAGNPLREGLKPLFTCDVWEHAYYLDFQNRRPDYVKAFWGIVNWAKIAERLG